MEQSKSINPIENPRIWKFNFEGKVIKNAYDIVKAIIIKILNFKIFLDHLYQKLHLLSCLVASNLQW